MIKIGSRVITPHGEGVVADKEEYSKSEYNRWGVSLNKNPFSTPIVFYSKCDVIEMCRCGIIDDCCCSDLNQG